MSLCENKFLSAIKGFQTANVGKLHHVVMSVRVIARVDYTMLATAHVQFILSNSIKLLTWSPYGVMIYHYSFGVGHDISYLHLHQVMIYHDTLSRLPALVRPQRSLLRHLSISTAYIYTALTRLCSSTAI